MRARAQQGHEIPARPPIRVEPGDLVEISDRDSEWPAFVFLTCDAGKGCVPYRHLDRSRGQATVVTGYDTTELPVAVGEEVTVVERDEASGWWWCRSDAGDEGWVPARVLLAQT